MYSLFLAKEEEEDNDFNTYTLNMLLCYALPTQWADSIARLHMPKHLPTRILTFFLIQ